MPERSGVCRTAVTSAGTPARELTTRPPSVQSQVTPSSRAPLQRREEINPRKRKPSGTMGGINSNNGRGRLLFLLPRRRQCAKVARHRSPSRGQGGEISAANHGGRDSDAAGPRMRERGRTPMLRHDTRVTSPKRIATHSAPPPQTCHPLRTKQGTLYTLALVALFGAFFPVRSSAGCMLGHQGRHLLQALITTVVECSRRLQPPV